MSECGQGYKFYYRAINYIDRINIGDFVLIDTRSEVKPCSIVLTSPDLRLLRAELIPTDQIIGEVVNAYIKH